MKNEGCIPSKELVMEWTVRVSSVPVGIIRADNRTKQAVIGRHLAMYALRWFCHMSTPEVAAYIGRKDHSTVVWGSRAAAEKYPDQVAALHRLFSEWQEKESKVYKVVPSRLQGGNL